MKYEIKRNKPKPGDVVARFGDWKKGEPTVLIEMHKWVNIGKPDQVIVEFSEQQTEQF